MKFNATARTGSRRLLPALIALLWLPAIVAAQTPELAADIRMTRHVLRLPDSLHNRRGLLLEEDLIKEVSPLLTDIFFDPGSAAIPERYHLLNDPSRTETFTDTIVAGSALDKYYHVLNIVGYRMRQDPDTKIEITGCNSGDAKSGETREISAQRGKAIYSYLVRIWGIDPVRIRLLPPRDLPAIPSSRLDSLGMAENRRAEIRSTDWRIVRPIVSQELGYAPRPEKMTFRMKNGIADALVARRVIEIRRHNQPWCRLERLGRTDTISPPYHWGYDERPDSLPNDEAPYTARLMVYDRRGREYRSSEITIPVKMISPNSRIGDQRPEPTLHIYRLLLFPVNSAAIDPLNERMLNEYIYYSIGEQGRITLTGFHDPGLSPGESNSRVPQQRIDAVIAGIRKNMRKDLNVSIESRIEHHKHPYSNQLPEGRFYNRTVEVMMENPVVIR